MGGEERLLEGRELTGLVLSGKPSKIGGEVLDRQGVDESLDLRRELEVLGTMGKRKEACVSLSSRITRRVKGRKVSSQFREEIDSLLRDS